MKIKKNSTELSHHNAESVQDKHMKFKYAATSKKKQTCGKLPASLFGTDI